MVARIISGRSIKGAVNYNEQKVSQHRATFLTAENYLKEGQKLNPLEKLFVLQHRAKLNERVKTNCLHISLNFETNEKIPAEKMQKIAKDYMERIGFSNQPYLVYKHQDAAHPHLHIVTTNIEVDGKRISLHNLGRNLSEKARQEIELKYGLVQATGRGKGEEISMLDLAAVKKASYGQDETKKAITQIVNTIVQKYNYSSLAELNAVLGRFNILADRGHEKSAMFSQKGLLYRILDENGNKLGVPIKASRIAGKYTLNKLVKRFEENKGKRKILGAALKHRINQVLKFNPSKSAFEKQLNDQKIEVLYRTSKDGHTYGITFIDHSARTVFNGSELGKAYGAQALMESFDKNKQQLVVKSLQYQDSHDEKKTGKQIEETRQIKDYIREYPPISYLDILLGKNEEDHSYQIPRKRKKRRKRNQQQNQITF